jgi:hypothetical protein
MGDVPEGINITELILSLVQELNQTNEELQLLREEQQSTRDALGHFFLVQMTITVFGLYGDIP